MLVILNNISDLFHYDHMCYDDLWSVIFDVTIEKNYNSQKVQMMVSIF